MSARWQAGGPSHLDNLDDMEMEKERVKRMQKRFISNFPLDGSQEGFLTWTTLTNIQEEKERVKRMLKRFISKWPLDGRQERLLTWKTMQR
jgi:hypothetical protein